jgi:acyl carrier protein
MTNLYDELTPIFREVFDEDTVVATPALTAGDVANWDSLSHVRLMVAIEERFGIRFTSAEISGFKNVGDMAASIEKKIG